MKCRDKRLSKISNLEVDVRYRVLFHSTKFNFITSRPYVVLLLQSCDTDVIFESYSNKNIDSLLDLPNLTITRTGFREYITGESQHILYPTLCIRSDEIIVFDHAQVVIEKEKNIKKIDDLMNN